jgi:hypothetical protein
LETLHTFHRLPLGVLSRGVVLAWCDRLKGKLGRAMAWLTCNALGKFSNFHMAGLAPAFSLLCSIAEACESNVQVTQVSTPTFRVSWWRELYNLVLCWARRNNEIWEEAPILKRVTGCQWQRKWLTWHRHTAELPRCSMSPKVRQSSQWSCLPKDRTGWNAQVSTLASAVPHNHSLMATTRSVSWLLWICWCL